LFHPTIHVFQEIFLIFTQMLFSIYNSNCICIFLLRQYAPVFFSYSFFFLGKTTKLFMKLFRFFPRFFVMFLANTRFSLL